MNLDPNSLASLGLKSPRRFVDRPAPRPVDLDVLRAYHRNQVPESEAEDIDHLVALFREWHEANGIVLAEICAELASAKTDQELASTKAEADCDGEMPLSKSQGNLFNGHKPQITWSQSVRIQRKSFSILATALVAAAGIGIYFLSRPSIVSEIWDGADGSQSIAIASDGTITGLPESELDLRTSVILAIREQTIQVRVRLPVLPGMKGSDIPPLSESFVLEPYHTVVSNVQPMFRWKGTAKAKSYEVHVYDESKTLIEKSEILTEPLWTPLNSLQRGQTFLWDVLVTFEDGTTSLPRNEPNAVFRILSEEEFARYQVTVARLKGFHSALGTYFVREGLLDEAQAEFEELLRLNPDSKSIQSLVEKARALRE